MPQNTFKRHLHFKIIVIEYWTVNFVDHFCNTPNFASVIKNWNAKNRFRTISCFDIDCLVKPIVKICIRDVDDHSCCCCVANDTSADMNSVQLFYFGWVKNLIKLIELLISIIKYKNIFNISKNYWRKYHILKKYIIKK